MPVATPSARKGGGDEREFIGPLLSADSLCAHTHSYTLCTHAQMTHAAAAAAESSKRRNNAELSVAVRCLLFSARGGDPARCLLFSARGGAPAPAPPRAENNKHRDVRDNSALLRLFEDSHKDTSLAHRITDVSLLRCTPWIELR